MSGRWIYFLHSRIPRVEVVLLSDLMPAHWSQVASQDLFCLLLNFADNLRWNTAGDDTCRDALRHHCTARDAPRCRRLTHP